MTTAVERHIWRRPTGMGPVERCRRKRGLSRAAALRERDRVRGARHVELAVYECDVCGRWHLCGPWR